MVPSPTVSGEKRPRLVGGEEKSAVKRAAGSGEAVAADLHECGRKRLLRHRIQVAGRVWIPEVWGKEEFLQDWADCAAVDRALLPMGLVSAKHALVEECRTARTQTVRIDLAAI